MSGAGETSKTAADTMVITLGELKAAIAKAERAEGVTDATEVIVEFAIEEDLCEGEDVQCAIANVCVEHRCADEPSVFLAITDSSLKISKALEARGRHP